MSPGRPGHVNKEKPWQNPQNPQSIFENPQKTMAKPTEPSEPSGFLARLGDRLEGVGPSIQDPSGSFPDPLENPGKTHRTLRTFLKTFRKPWQNPQNPQNPQKSRLG